MTLAAHHAAELQRLAGEAGVTLSALCAHVLERYAIQDHALMANDVIAQRLEAITERHAAQFAQRFGDVLLRVAHEVVAHRRQTISELAATQGEDTAKRLSDASWSAAVTSLRPYTQRVRGDTSTTSEAAQ